VCVNSNVNAQTTCEGLIDGTYPGENWNLISGQSYGRLYTNVSCPTRVGIGLNDPTALLHIRPKFLGSTNKLFLVEGVMGQASAQPIFQITNDGITRAREIIVDLEVWPDYVFKPSYQLMPLRDLRSYIKLNGHLPNVPSAMQIQRKGLSLSQNARFAMEKIEELTLYVLDLQDQIDRQNLLIQQQQELLLKMQALLDKEEQDSDTNNTVEP
jgi:hypothetical protein